MNSFRSPAPSRPAPSSCSRCCPTRASTPRSTVHPCCAVCPGNPAQLTKVGDEFTLNMHNDILNDYQMLNTVTAFEPNRVIGWSPTLYPPDGYTDKLGEMKPGGHTYTWQLEPTGDGQTRVTQTYDWSKVTDPEFKKILPLLNEQQLADSIDNVSRLAT